MASERQNRRDQQYEQRSNPYGNQTQHGFLRGIVLCCRWISHAPSHTTVL